MALESPFTLAHTGRHHREKIPGTNSVCYDGIPVDGGEKNLTNSLFPKVIRKKECGTNQL